MAKELTYEAAFPGRFLKAALFEGKNVTLTIESAFLEILEGEKGKESKLILTFVGKTMQLVCNKTNALCIKEMFGNKIPAWIGKRIMFYPTHVAFGPKQVDAIRVYGSADIDADVEVTARIGRKNFKATMRAVKGAQANGHAPVTPTNVDPRIQAAWGILGLADGPANMAEFGGDAAAYLSHLNRLIDEGNAA
jgi:hypothetical protein